MSVITIVLIAAPVAWFSWNAAAASLASSPDSPRALLAGFALVGIATFCGLLARPAAELRRHLSPRHYGVLLAVSGTLAIVTLWRFGATTATGETPPSWTMLLAFEALAVSLLCMRSLRPRASLGAMLMLGLLLAGVGLVRDAWPSGTDGPAPQLSPGTPVSDDRAPSIAPPP